MDTKDSSTNFTRWSVFPFNVIEHVFSCSAALTFYITVQACGPTYLIWLCDDSSGQTEVWCGVGVACPAGGVLSRTSLVVLGLRRTEGPS